MATCREITKKYATDYVKSDKSARGLILDDLVAVTGWSRASARRPLAMDRQRKGPAKSVVRIPRGRPYGYNTLRVLISVWRLAEMPSGKYLAATMGIRLLKFQAFGELDAKRLTPAVRAQLLQVSGATIDRLLRPTKDADRPNALSATKAAPKAGPRLRLRSSITVRKAGEAHEQAPGFIEADMVLHYGPTLAGEFARTLTATDVFTDWTEHVAARNGPHNWVLEAMDEIVVRLPFPMAGLDTDNGGEFINRALIKWAGERNIYFTRSRPYKSNDSAHVEQKNGDVLRRHAFQYRNDTTPELKLLNGWPRFFGQWDLLSWGLD